MFTISALLWMSSALPALPPAGGGGIERGVRHDEMPAEVVARIEAELAVNVARLMAEGKLPRSRTPSISGLIWPLQARSTYLAPDYHGVSNFVDLNPAFDNGAVDTTGDYQCLDRTYDLSNYNHGGIDYFLWPFPWKTMDSDQIEIVAAAPGTIIGKSDGFNDRSCLNNYSADWNAVYVQHSDATTMWYGHMQSGSLTSKAIGQTVAAGEYLGLVGSSGFSTGPHLHMELRNSANNGVIEPYFGSCNAAIGSSLWASQRPYNNTRINRIATHNAAPSHDVSCPNPGQEAANFSDQFQPGNTVYFGLYLQDQVQPQSITLTVRRPDNSVFQTWTFTSANDYSASWWYWSYTLPANAPSGTWTYTSAMTTPVAQTVNHTFTVDNVLFANSFE